jgi:subtilisin-like proprotein convertase family protein
MSRRLILLTSVLLMLGLVGANSAFGEVIDIRIANGGDDAEQHLDDGRMDIGSSDLELPYEDGGSPATDEQVIGLRFVDVPLEAGAVIADAYVEIEVDKVDKEGSLAPVNLIIEGELALDAAPFEDIPNNITDRPTTVEKVKWSIPEWTEQNAKYQSPNVASIIEEIISQEGWASGGAIVLIVRDDKDNPSTGLRESESADGEADAAALLRIILADEANIRIANGLDDAEEHVDSGNMDLGSSDLEIPYEDGGSPATDEQVIGLRFLDIPLDPGGLVMDAYIEVEVDKVDKEGSTAPVNVIIEGELVPNAAPFEDVAGNISSRLTTEAKVAWSIPEWTEQNAKFQSPDVSVVIQEIVNQEGWESGNAIVLIIRDDKDNPSTGLREAESFDGESDAAPLLHIAGALTIVRNATEPVPADGTIGVSYAPAISAYDSSDVPKDIPDWSWDTQKNTLGEVTSTLDVPDSITIKDLNVELDITMPGGRNGDLNVYVKSPDGKKVKLFDDVGILVKGSFTNTILDDEASTSIKSTRTFTGIYKPEGKLSDFDGRDSMGTWKLEITDDWPGGPGKLNSWRVVIENPITISWLPGFDVASHDVYLSNSFDDVNDSVALLGTVPGDVGTIDVGAL